MSFAFFPYIFSNPFYRSYGMYESGGAAVCLIYNKIVEFNDINFLCCSDCDARFLIYITFCWDPLFTRSDSFFDDVNMPMVENMIRYKKF